MMLAQAFKRGDAFNRLESYAPVIVEHLALVSWYPDTQAVNHWNVEIDAYMKILRRYNNGKKKSDNFDVEDIVRELKSHIEYNEEKDYLLIAMKGHGQPDLDNPDWDALEKATQAFAERVCA